jgi:hypothetical protein
MGASAICRQLIVFRNILGHTDTIPECDSSFRAEHLHCVGSCSGPRWNEAGEQQG